MLTSGNPAFEVRVFLSGTMLATFFFTELYGFKNLIFLEEFMCVLKSGLMMFLIDALYLFGTVSELPMFYVIFATSLFISMSITARYLFRCFLFRCLLFKLGLLSKSVLVIGAGRTGVSFAENVIASPFTLRKLAGFIDDDSTKRGQVISGAPVLGKMKDFAHIQDNLNADEVVIAITALNDDELAKILGSVGEMAKRVLVVPEVYTLATPTSSVHDGGLSPSVKLRNPLNMFIKTAIDYTGAVVALIIFSPIMLWAAWMIKREDGGDIFFIQERVGYKTIPFRVCKFRTMYMDAEERTKILFSDKEIFESYKQGIKLKDDSRVTRIGRILRKTSIDELPQLFNVLRGEMSLVGPRPLMQSDVDIAYGAYAGRRIYSVKPGMTGLWQVSGRSEIDTDIRKELNLYYAHNWSVWLDIVILLKTPMAVFMKRGAY